MTHVIIRRALLAASLAAALLSAALPGPAAAQVIETREGDSNPMVAVFKSTIYGAGAGTLLGLAVAVADDDDDSEPIRWGFVAGTFFGFAYGIYHVSTRPEPRALLEHDARGWAMAPPAVAPDGRGARVRLFALRF
jgi:hypothetical protein